MNEEQQYEGRRKQEYDFPVHLEQSSNVHRIELEQITPGSRVLDVGCHTGIFGRILIDQKGCSVVGIDYNAEALCVARGVLEEAIELNIESPGWSQQAAPLGPFDHIIFGDVLEHTSNPERILEEARGLLTTASVKHAGTVIVSVPNIANLRVRQKILMGNFDYTESGILDRTHLRFFTCKTARELLENSGYEVLHQDVAGYRLPHWMLRQFPGLLAVQIVLVGRPR